MLTSEEKLRALEEKEQKRRKKLKLRSSDVWIERERDGKRLLKMSFIDRYERKKRSRRLR